MKSIFKLGMKIRYFSIFAKVELLFVWKARRITAICRFTLNGQACASQVLPGFPWDIPSYGVHFCFSVVVNTYSGIGVWWCCDGCRQEDRTPIPKGLETEEHVSSFFLPWSCFLCPSWITMFLVVWFKLVLWSWISVPFTLSCQILIKRAIFFGKRKQV